MFEECEFAELPVSVMNFLYAVYAAMPHVPDVEEQGAAA